MDLVFVLDSSTGITEQNFRVMKDFIKDFLSNANIDDGNVRVGVISYSTQDYLQFHLKDHQDKRALFNAIDAMPYRRGRINMADAFNTMRTRMFTAANGDRPTAPNVAIVVAGGVSNVNRRKTIPEAEQARADGIHMYAIGVGLPDTTELKGVVSKPVDENLFTARQFSQLKNLGPKIVTSLRSRTCINIKGVLRIRVKIQAFEYLYLVGLFNHLLIRLSV